MFSSLALESRLCALAVVQHVCLQSLAGHIVLPDTLCLLHDTWSCFGGCLCTLHGPLAGYMLLAVTVRLRICFSGLCTLHGPLVGLHVVGFSSCTLHGPLAGYMLSALTVHSGCWLFFLMFDHPLLCLCLLCVVCLIFTAGDICGADSLLHGYPFLGEDA